MTNVLHELIGLMCLAHLDDVIVFSKRCLQHVDDLLTVLDRIRAPSLKLKSTKCKFFL